ncbi:hypothetical protein PoB_002519100 [Plakobranchus ocellatus]|uniref:Uncharacterized protein n=1 Tax=Plakobranchus ocellatus TaxID=259542 RepID=A0AAV3ZRU1_9GAST|nr:hypothetical protein PoB_002519100 [Plakobranchus ocellatus]
MLTLRLIVFLTTPQGDLRFSGPPSGLGDCGGARTRDSKDSSKAERKDWKLQCCINHAKNLYHSNSFCRDLTSGHIPYQNTKISLKMRSVTTAFKRLILSADFSPPSAKTGPFTQRKGAQQSELTTSMYSGHNYPRVLHRVTSLHQGCHSTLCWLLDMYACPSNHGQTHAVATKVSRYTT